MILMDASQPIYFTSDSHYYHKNVIKHCGRGPSGSGISDEDKHLWFKDQYEMNEHLIKAWNDTVPDNAQVFHIGDFSFAAKEKSAEILKRLNGRIHIILGNHDRKSENFFKEQPNVDWVGPYREIYIEDSETEHKQPIVLFHYPILSWNKIHYGAFHIHVHCHGSVNHMNGNNILRLDVGVDTRKDYRPYSYHEIKEIMSKRTFKPIDHHKEY